MKGGARYGAGRPALHHKTTAYPSIGVSDLKGHLGTPGDALDVALTYIWQGEQAICRILLTRTTCAYGGCRYWFLCPQCGTRVAIIYLGADPGCRECFGLHYPSQSENAIQRGWWRLNKVERLLAAGAEKWNCRRPKGMHWVTFERLLRERCRLQKLSDDACTAFIVRSWMCQLPMAPLRFSNVDAFFAWLNG